MDMRCIDKCNCPPGGFPQCIGKGYGWGGCLIEVEQSPQAACEAVSECMNLLSGKLTHIAANLLKARLSDCDEDYPKKFPKHVLRTIEKHNECIRRLACELIDIKRAI